MITRNQPTKNITDVTKVKNVSTDTIVSFAHYTILPGQVVLVDDRYWIGQSLWKKYRGILEGHHRKDIVQENETSAITFAVNEYLASDPTQRKEVVVEGVTYGGLVVKEGQNYIIYIKEGAATPIEPTGITVTGNATMTVGDTQTLTATVAPTTATDKTVVWLSENPTKASVNPETGLVTAKAAGTAIIHAISTVNGIDDDFTITVSAAESSE